MSKVIFIPWDEGRVASEIGEARDWQTERPGVYKIACYTGAKVQSISSLAVGHLYVVGHGAPGDSTIDSDSGDSIDYQETVNRVIKSGLSKWFSGAIKIYACNSGVRTNSSAAFAKLFAKEIYSRGYLLCRVYGYNGSLSAYYVDIGTHKHAHKRARIKDDDDNIVSETRASNNRMYFSGLF